MIDTMCEELVLLTKAGRIINPSSPPHVATIWRWATRGVRGVTLESCLVGGQRFTSREATARFLAALNAGQPNAVSPPPNRRAERAERELIGKGC